MLKATRRIVDLVGRPADLCIRLLPEAGLEVVYLRTMVEPLRAEHRLIGRLVEAKEPAPTRADALLSWVRETLWLGSVRAATSPEEACRALLDGEAVICSALPGYVLADVHGAEHRPPQEPETEAVIRGPRDGFTETLHTNLSLIRVRLRDPSLRIEERRVGSRSRTKVALVFLAGVASAAIVREVRARLDKIAADRSITSGDIEQWIEDTPWSPYPQIQATERPDKVVAGLLEGRIALLTEGTPFTLLVPTVMISFFQSTEDYEQRWIAGSLLRILRSGALAVSLLAPSFYIAMARFNPELMPLKMALSLAASREGIPFPIVVEALVIEAMVELLREAGNRMPKPLGPALGIVGGLVVGDIAVRAGLVSPFMVIVVGLTALGSFAIPSYEAALTTRILRFPMMVITGLFGIVGMILFILLVFAHLCSLKSFGVPYLTPFGQLAYGDWADTFIRGPTRYLARRRPGTYALPGGHRRDGRSGGDTRR